MNTILFVSFTLLSCVFSYCRCFELFRPKALKIYKFDGRCSHMPNMTMFFTDIHLTQTRKTNSIAAKIVCIRDTSSTIKLDLSLTRCKNKEAADTCENYQSMRINRLCDLVNAKGQPWTPFTTKAEPPLECPVKAGTYVVKNGTFDVSALTAMPVLNEGWYWKIEAKARDEVVKEVILCVYIEAQITAL